MTYCPECGNGILTGGIGHADDCSLKHRGLQTGFNPSSSLNSALVAHSAHACFAIGTFINALSEVLRHPKDKGGQTK